MEQDQQFYRRIRFNSSNLVPLRGSDGEPLRKITGFEFTHPGPWSGHMDSDDSIDLRDIRRSGNTSPVSWTPDSSEAVEMPTSLVVEILVELLGAVRFEDLSDAELVRLRSAVSGLRSLEEHYDDAVQHSRGGG